MIYHMLPREVWRNQLSDQPYCGDTLASEGFIHCTAEAERLLVVANTWYKEHADQWLILCIAEEDVEAEIRWEENHGHIFPHIYGPLSLDAVTNVIPFPRANDGTFLPPIQELL